MVKRINKNLFFVIISDGIIRLKIWKLIKIVGLFNMFGELKIMRGRVLINKGIIN